MSAMVPGPLKGVIARVAVPATSECTAIWNGSDSFLAALIWMRAPVALGGAASRSTLSIVVVVQIVAPGGEGSANVLLPVGVQSVHFVPPPPLPLVPVEALALLPEPDALSSSPEQPAYAPTAT